MAPISTNQRRGRWFVLPVGWIVLLIGVVLAGGGAWLLAVGGSAYYLLAGVALVISGLLIARHQIAGAWLYVLIVVATIIWAIWEVGLNGWALVPRIVAPMVLLILVLATMPFLDLRYRGRSVGLVILTIVIVFGATSAAIGWINRPALQGVVPKPGSIAMDDPAPLDVGADWPAYGGSYSARRYSPLAQITPANVSKLTRAWSYHTRDLPEGKGPKNYGAETTPLKVGETLYLCTPKNIMIALDATNGSERWRFDPKVDDKFIPYTAACRGVAYYAAPDGDAAKPCAARIIEGTLDARLIAVDAATGAPCADFGEAGQVQTSAGMGEFAPGMVSITSAPTIVRGIIVTGHQILDGQRRDAPSGVIQGFDAVTGALRWAWDLKAPDRSGAPPSGEIYSRGTPNMWTTASADEQLGLVYLPLGNSAVDYWSGSRSDAEKEYSTSLVALNVNTGKPVWTFQTVHNDVWDYDLGSQGSLVDFHDGNAVVPAIILPSKQGDIYVLDRRSGETLTAVEERSVPGGGVEPEQRSLTQPFSMFHTLRRPDLVERNMWGMSPIDQMICRIQFRMAKYDGFYTAPTSEQHYIEYPGYNGGSDWGGIAIDPRRGIIIANYNDMPNYNRLIPRAEADKMGWAPRGEERGRIGGAEGAGDPQAGTPYAVNVNAGWRIKATGLLCKEPPYGGIRAIDLHSGKTLWDVPLGTARTNGPFGIPSRLPIDIGTPNNGGAVVTAGGLIFIAAATDNLIRAIDIETGRTVWQDVLPGGGQATPMTYEVGGRQYLAIMAGGHHFMETPIGDELIVYALSAD